MKFMEAIEELKKGNKIRLPKWEKDFHWGLTEYDVYSDDLELEFEKKKN